MSQMLFLCHAHELKPGHMRRFKLGPHGILLANIAGNFYAVDDLCSHEDAILSNGALKGNCVECPLHGSRFDLTTGMPQEEPATLPVCTYTVHIVEGRVLIDLK